MGHELPRHRQDAASALPPEAVATVAGRCVRFGPLTTFCTAVKQRAISPSDHREADFMFAVALICVGDREFGSGFANLVENLVR
jgi:hypothetical protein